MINVVGFLDFDLFVILRKSFSILFLFKKNIIERNMKIMKRIMVDCELFEARFAPTILSIMNPGRRPIAEMITSVLIFIFVRPAMNEIASSGSAGRRYIMKRVMSPASCER